MRLSTDAAPALAFTQVVRYGSPLTSFAVNAESEPGPGEEDSISRKRKTLAFLLCAIPFLAMCFSVSLWDRIYPLVFGLPFNLFWLMAWIPLSALCLTGVYFLRKPFMAAKDDPS